MRKVEIVVVSPVNRVDTLLLLKEIEHLHKQRDNEEAEVARVAQLQLTLHPEVDDEA